LLKCMSPLLAQSGHPDALNQCQLLGVKRIPSTMVKTSNQRDNHDRYLGVRYSSMMCLPR
jgi:hypothetical protein